MKPRHILHSISNNRYKLIFEEEFFYLIKKQINFQFENCEKCSRHINFQLLKVIILVLRFCRRIIRVGISHKE